MLNNTEKVSPPRFFKAFIGERRGGRGFNPEESPDDFGGGSIECELCPRRCVLPPGGSGFCRVRFNRGGGEIPLYGFVTALARDPIEKKPLYHFRPGSSILSAGFSGCNMRCPFCQNWHLSQREISQSKDAAGRNISPREIIDAAEEAGGQIAYTYSEPLVHFEYVLDCMREARRRGVANVLVTNGCINSAAARELLLLADAVNIDLKSFSKKTYAEVLGGDLETVLKFIGTALENDVHVELTTLVVPGLNDGEDELEACAEFIAALEGGGRVVPWHLSAYHPAWKWEARPTAPDFLLKAAEKARGRVSYVYTGNISGEKNDTACQYCGGVLVSRDGRRVETGGLSLNAGRDKKYFCARCGEKAPFRF